MKIHSKTFFIAILITTMAAAAYPETFEFIDFSPPSGWAKQQLADGIAYKRSNGIGAIAIYASTPSSGSAETEFAKLWQSRVVSVIRGMSAAAAPKPKLERDGDFSAAIGAQQVDMQGTITSISLVAFAGRGRVIGILSISAGDDVFEEITSFLNTISVSKTPVSPGQGAANASSSGIDTAFEVPSGYRSEKLGPMVVMKPLKMDDNTPCIYGLSPSRPSSGDLEADARAALLEPHTGWRIKDQSYQAMRGVSGDGWPYYWFRTGIETSSPAYNYVNAMAMAFPAGNGRVNILWGVGPAAHCMLDDSSFARVFQSLKPAGWTSDGGKALERELLGTWRNTQRLGMSQYKFLPGGRYEYGLGSTTVTGIFERNSASAHNGRFALGGSALTLSEDSGTRKRYLIRIFDHYNSGGWIRVMALVDPASAEPVPLEFSKITDR